MGVKYKKAETINEFIDLIRLRVEVFVIEQGFEPGWEPDEDDKTSTHFIALSNKKVVGTVRFIQEKKGEYKIGRMCVLKEYRKKGVGRGLMKFMMKELMKLKPKRVWMKSQVRAKGFYEKHGFAAVSKQKEEYGCPHVEMELKFFK